MTYENTPMKTITACDRVFERGHLVPRLDSLCALYLDMFTDKFK